MYFVISEFTKSLHLTFFLSESKRKKVYSRYFFCVIYYENEGFLSQTIVWK